MYHGAWCDPRYRVVLALAKGICADGLGVAMSSGILYCASARGAPEEGHGNRFRFGLILWVDVKRLSGM
jgi:hypothetical protein